MVDPQLPKRKIAAIEPMISKLWLLGVSWGLTSWFWCWKLPLWGFMWDFKDVRYVRYRNNFSIFCSFFYSWPRPSKKNDGAIPIKVLDRPWAGAFALAACKSNHVQPPWTMQSFRIRKERAESLLSTSFYPSKVVLNMGKRMVNLSDNLQYDTICTVPQPTTSTKCQEDSITKRLSWKATNIN